MQTHLRQYFCWTLALLVLGCDTVKTIQAAYVSESFSAIPLNICFADQESFSIWQSIFNGYGCTMIENNNNPMLHQQPAVSRASGETHASMVLGPSFNGPFTYRGRLQTLKQLRRNSTPNPWEVAWVIWHYTDNDHFYYFIPKPNGWELGKRDPAYPGSQRFLATGSIPKFPIKRWYDFQIDEDTIGSIGVTVNGVRIVQFSDTETPYTEGRIGLYNEDAHVHFDDIIVTPTQQ